MYYDPFEVRAIHQDRIDHLRRVRNPRRGRRDPDRTPPRRPRRTRDD